MKKPKRKQKRRRGRVTEELVVGEIGDALLKRLYAVPDYVRMIDVHVCSPGGSFYAAVAAIEIFRRWQRKGKVVRTVALGEVCSSATLLVAGGSHGHRYSYRSTLWGLHLPFVSGELIEDALIQKADGKLLKHMEAQCCQLLKELSGSPAKEWQRLLGQASTRWYDGAGAKSLGLVDEVLS